jgi:hypothetical protein
LHWTFDLRTDGELARSRRSNFYDVSRTQEHVAPCGYRLSDIIACAQDRERSRCVFRLSRHEAAGPLGAERAKLVRRGKRRIDFDELGAHLLHLCSAAAEVGVFEVLNLDIYLTAQQVEP